MKLKDEIIRRLKSLDRALVYRFRNVSLPGFQGKSIYEVLRFFVHSLFFEEDQNLRASSLAFNFFLALFPTIIFLFTLIAYVPISNMHDMIIEQLQAFLPPSAFEFLIGTINDILKKQNAGLLSFGFVFALYFASNGFANMISAFDMDVERAYQRNWFTIRMRAFGLTFLVTTILVTTILLSIASSWIMYEIGKVEWVETIWIETGVKVLEYFLTFMLVYLIFSSLYYFGSDRTSQWRFFSPGSTAATFLSIITSYGFTLYVENFNSYNKLYGSIGTILVIMILIYFNSFVVLIGYQLNKSIDKVE